MALTPEQLAQLRASADFARGIPLDIPNPGTRKASREEQERYLEARTNSFRETGTQLKRERDHTVHMRHMRGDINYKISGEEEVRLRLAPIFEETNPYGSSKFTEAQKHEMVVKELKEGYRDVCLQIVEGRFEPNHELVRRLEAIMAPIDLEAIREVVMDRAERGILNPEELNVVLENGEEVRLEGDEAWAREWIQTDPERSKRLGLKLGLLNRVTDRLGGMKIFGNPAGEFIVSRVVGGGTRMAARTILSWAGVAGFVGGGLAGGAVVGAGIGAASGFAVEYFRQLMEFRGEVKAEWKRAKEENISRRAAGEAELELRKVSLKEKLFTVKSKKKLAVAAAKGAAMGVVGGAFSPLIAAFLEEHGITLDFLRGVSGVKDISNWAGGAWEGAGRGINEISGGRLDNLDGVVQKVGDAVQQSETLNEVKDELAKTKAQLAEAENKLQGLTKRLGNLSGQLNDAASKDAGVTVYGEHFDAEEAKTVARYSQAVAKSLGVEEPVTDSLGGAFGDLTGNSVELFKVADIGDFVEVEAGSNPWNETDEIMTKLFKQLNIPKPPQGEWNEIIRQANPKLCADNGYSWGAGIPGKDARFIPIGTKLQITKEFKDVALNLVKKAA